MWFSPIFERFVEKSPVTVMVRAMMEVILAPEKLDELFEQTAQTGYTRELLFSTLVMMMTQVVCSIRQSMGSVYKAMSAEIGVSKTAVYDKLNRLEPNVIERGQKAEGRGQKDQLVGDSDPPLIEDQQAKLAGGIKPNKFEGKKKNNQPSAICLLPSAICLPRRKPW